MSNLHFEALLEIRRIANEPGDRRALVDRIYGIATEASRTPAQGAWPDGEREGVARALFGDGWKCCADLAPYVRGLVAELECERQVLATFDPDLVEHQRDLIEQTTGPLREMPQVPQGAGIGAGDLEHTPRQPPQVTEGVRANPVPADYSQHNAEIVHLRANLDRIVKVIDDRLMQYDDIEKNSKGGLTEYGKHAQLAVRNIRRDVEFALTAARDTEGK